MLRNFSKETRAILSAISEAMQATYPSKQFSAEIVLAGINLGLTERRIKQTNNLNERRTFINEFDRIKCAIEGDIELLDKGPRRKTYSPERKAVCIS